MTFLACDHHERGLVKTKWANHHQQKLKIEVSKIFKYAIRKFACVNDWTETFIVEVFTHFTTNISNVVEDMNYHATEYLTGGSWYDHVMVQFEEDDKSNTDTTCPVRVYGFLYITPGVPIPTL